MGAVGGSGGLDSDDGHYSDDSDLFDVDLDEEVPGAGILSTSQYVSASDLHRAGAGAPTVSAAGTLAKANSLGNVVAAGVSQGEDSGDNYSLGSFED